MTRYDLLKAHFKWRYGHCKTFQRKLGSISRSTVSVTNSTALRPNHCRGVPSNVAFRRFSIHSSIGSNSVAIISRKWRILLALGLLASSFFLTDPRNRNTLNDAPSIDLEVDTNHLPKVKHSDLRSTVYPALFLAAADSKLKREEMSTTFTQRRSTDVIRFDSLRLPSNNPVEDELSYSSIDVGRTEEWKFWGVYDGHAGWATSKVLRDTLAIYVAHELRKAQISAVESYQQTEVVDQAIKWAFLNLDGEIISDGLQAVNNATSHAEAISKIAPARAGSCALLAAFDPANATLRIACTGDSRAVLGRRKSTSGAPDAEAQFGYQAEALSVDQTGFNESERTRIDKEHPEEPKAIDLKSGRLLGLAITRAFGDHRWKWPLEAVEKCKLNFYGPSPRPEYHTPPYLTAEPVVTTAKVSRGDFLILASDGLWDHMSSEDAVECVSLWLNKARRSMNGNISSQHMSSQDVSEKSQTSPTIQGKVTESPSTFNYYYKGTPEHFVVEDSNAATHLVRNALGGSRRELFCSVLSVQAPDSRMVRDDVTVQVIFFGDVFGEEK